MTAPIRLDQALTAATAAFAVMGSGAPGTLSGQPASAGQTYYARMYAARSLPLAAALLLAGRDRRRGSELYAVAAAAQLGDAAVGLATRRWGQVPPTLLAAVVYAREARRRAARTGRELD